MLPVAIFLNGFALMVLEMSGARLLAPHLGTSIVVWTSLIGIILASLSLGNWLGGRFADRVLASASPVKKKKQRGSEAAEAEKAVPHGAYAVLGRLFLAAASLVLLTALLQDIVFAAVTDAVSSLHLRTVLIAVLLFAPASILCGMISPYIVRLAITGSRNSGGIIGRLNALGTLGSIAGTFLGGFVLISWFGTVQVIYGVAFTFLLGAALSSRGLLISKASVCVLLGLCMAMQFYFEREREKAGIIHSETAYNSIRILEGTMENRPVKLLQTDPGSFQSGELLEDPAELLFAYTRYYGLGTALRPEAKQVLMLGGGGYSVPKWLLAGKSELRDFRLDVVELDPGITKAAIEYFSVPKNDPRLRVFHEDARTFVNRMAAQGAHSPSSNAEGPYDLIFADIFNSHYSIPFHVGTREAAANIRTLLAPDGIFIMNIISALEGDNGRLLRAIHGAFQKEFPSTRLFLVQYPSNPGSIQNIMLAASTLEQEAFDAVLENDERLAAFKRNLWRGKVEADVPPLADNFAPVERYTLGFVR